jgi:hypothetical protein
LTDGNHVRKQKKGIQHFFATIFPLNAGRLELDGVNGGRKAIGKPDWEREASPGQSNRGFMADYSPQPATL